MFGVGNDQFVKGRFDLRPCQADREHSRSQASCSLTGFRKSASISKVRLPPFARKAAKPAATVVFPSPGSAETIPITLPPVGCRSMATLMYRKRFGGRRKRRNFADLSKAAESLGDPQLARSTAACRQKPAEPQDSWCRSRLFQLRTRMNLAAHLFASERQHHSKAQTRKRSRARASGLSWESLAQPGGDANVTTRASVEGNDCCCTD